MKYFNESVGTIVPEKIEDFTVWKAELDDEDISNVSKVLQEEIEKANSPTLQEKLVELKDLLNK